MRARAHTHTHTNTHTDPVIIILRKPPTPKAYIKYFEYKMRVSVFPAFARNNLLFRVKLDKLSYKFFIIKFYEKLFAFSWVFECTETEGQRGFSICSAET
jgi:hypothetical protein